MGIFDKRVEFKPYEYEHLLQFRKTIKSTPWHAEEYDFGDDIQDFHTVLNKKEQNVIKNAMLAISQIEAESVKTFWAKIGDWIPKPEVAMVGMTLGENEVTHSESYSMLLEILGFNDEFKKLLNNDVISNRINYLSKYLRGSGDNVVQFNTLRLALFSLFVENVSLFGQFLIIKSFRRHKNLLKSIDNVVLATQSDEICHAEFGIELLKIIKDENPSWFDDDFYKKIERAAIKAFEAECGIVDWIFEKGDLDIISSHDVKEFLKRRFNDSLLAIGCRTIFEDLDEESAKRTFWFDEEISGYIRNDFFNTKSKNYSDRNVSSRDIKKGIEIYNGLV